MLVQVCSHHDLSSTLADMASTCACRCTQRETVLVMNVGGHCGTGAADFLHRLHHDARKLGCDVQYSLVHLQEAIVLALRQAPTLQLKLPAPRKGVHKRRACNDSCPTRGAVTLHLHRINGSHLLTADSLFVSSMHLWHHCAAAKSA